LYCAKGAASLLAWGNAPQVRENKKKPVALKARFTSGVISFKVSAVPQSLSKVTLHIIFSTKDREPWLGSEVRPRMHAYLATILP